MTEPADPTGPSGASAGSVTEAARLKLPPETARRLAEQQDTAGPRMLPGMAMIAIFMLVISMANAFNVLAHAQAFRPSARYTILAVCSCITIGVFGFLRLRRWGWALLMGGTFFYALGNAVLFFQSKQVGYLLPTAFSLVFFLYLVRDEVRERVH